MPDTADSAAEVLIEGYNAWVANVLDDPENSQSFTPVPTTWTLVERAADSGGGIPGATDALAAGIRMRSLAGQPCPREGYWFTPVRQDSRRRFVYGELMPDVAGDYGATSWQWDERQ